MKFIYASVACLVCSISAMAQYVASGKVVDQSNGEALVGATVRINESRGVVTNYAGEFKITKVRAGEYTMQVDYIGYQTQTTQVTISTDVVLNFELEATPFITDEVIVSATRASDKTPTTYSSVSKEEIEAQNMGQDLPYLLKWSPSVVTTSDAGAGIGYTGLRIRGSDASRINVTINGVPLNDSESQGVFWVDIPDIASSTENIQIQRGVGTSTNGAGAFGGTINLQTNTRSENAYGDVINSAGSFNTWRHTVGFGTGLLNNRWTFDGRVSKITSDGYIDRATSDLQSYYLSGGYYGKKTMIKAILFGGAERTYQSWYGTPQAVLDNDVEGIEEVIINNGLDDEEAANLRTSGRTFNWYLYENEVDDYKQDHYQLHIAQQLAAGLSFNGSLHYTYGRGYYEQYRKEDDFADYGLENVVIGDSTLISSDFIRRRWLDNDFYGVTYALNYGTDKVEATLGGAYNFYRGDHFGELIWAEQAANFEYGDRYYDNNGNKDDFNIYLKTGYQFNDQLYVFGDLQYRNIKYKTTGIDSDLRPIDISATFDFFNPKFGVTYVLNGSNSIYASYAVANREPVRSDFIDSPNKPKPETLRNLEMGYHYRGSKLRASANFYLMDYTDQLVLTGEVNDVGSLLRQNVENSYRMGIELQAGVQFTRKWALTANMTLSRNRIDRFHEVIYDYGPAFDEYNVITNEYNDTNIAFSPSAIAGTQLIFKPAEFMEVAWLSKFVGDQYLDNTSNENRKINSYWVNDIRTTFTVSPSFLRSMDITLLVNNVFDEMYSSNGYTFGYQGGPDYVVRENYYYPQAGTNFLASLAIKF